MHRPIHRPMHNPACPSTKNPILPCTQSVPNELHDTAAIWNCIFVWFELKQRNGNTLTKDKYKLSRVETCVANCIPSANFGKVWLTFSLKGGINLFWQCFYFFQALNKNFMLAIQSLYESTHFTPNGNAHFSPFVVFCVDRNLLLRPWWLGGRALAS